MELKTKRSIPDSNGLVWPNHRPATAALGSINIYAIDADSTKKMSYYANRANVMGRLINVVDPRAIYRRFQIVREGIVHGRSYQLRLLERIETQKPTWVIQHALVRRLPFPNHSPIVHPDEESRRSCPFCCINEAASVVVETRCTVQHVAQRVLRIKKLLTVDYLLYLAV
ncbi:hypothetical protein BDZ89DRAFT_1148225 [Hymenopellis radicata]|nr:hypothetical protein BDZ89DRAFT_1148225 [Hymenopellis radicata]